MGCAVYVPTVPSTPLLEKGQMEISAGIRSISSLEAGAAWSPVAHILLSGETAIQHIKDEQTQNGVAFSNVESHQQVGIAMGVYTLTKGVKPVYLAAMAGIGTARADVHEVHLFGPNDRFEAQYRRYYGQLYFAQLEPGLVWGASVRGAWVDYQQLLRQGDPVMPTARFYLEPHFFVRRGEGPLQGYATLGVSLPVTHEAAGDHSTNGMLAPTSTLLGLGVIFKPYLLQRAK